MHEVTWTQRDLSQLQQRGITPDEATRQLRMLREPPGVIQLDRPCTVGDGIVRLSDEECTRLGAVADGAQQTGRCMKFVPASGAASRMFQSLLVVAGSGASVTREMLARRADAGEAAARDALQMLDALPRFAFYDALTEAMARRGQPLVNTDDRCCRAILDCLLAADGLNYAALPKALIPFHREGKTSRTAVEEHLAEAAGYVQDSQGRCRLHLTVSAEHEQIVVAFLDEVRPEHERRLGCRFEMALSVQHPSSDTLAIDASGAPARTPDGMLILRPGGHGALLDNLQGCGGDIVFIKNIDNVAPDRLKPQTLRWKRALGGLLVELQQESRGHLDHLAARPDDQQAMDAATQCATSRLGWTMSRAGTCSSVAALRAAVVSALNRPLRVCGVVRNTGEPGGGPFWVKGPSGGVSAQLVESAQVDAGSAEQRRLYAASTHFNPVDLVCGLRDAQGASFPLRDYVDQHAVVVTRKVQDGRELRVLERPGLWNGAMTHWNTVFVEVPGETFTPVKSVLDLLRPSHQPA
jgi:hypothetical protein